MDKKIKKAVRAIIKERYKKVKAEIKKVLEFEMKDFSDLVKDNPTNLMEYLTKKYDKEKQDTNSVKFITWVLNAIDKGNFKMYLDKEAKKPTKDARWFVKAVEKERKDLLSYLTKGVREIFKI